MAYTAEILKATVNQGEIIKEIEADYKKDNNQSALKHINSIKGGICYMLSIEWLRLIHQTEAKGSIVQAFPNWITEFATQVHFKLPAGLAYYKQIANNFLSYIEKENGAYKCITTKIQDGKEIKSDDDKAFVEICTNKKMEVESFHYPLDKNALVDKIMEDVSFMLIGVYFGSKAHETALYCKCNKKQPGEKKLYFFDCNYGIYEITAQEEAELRSKIETLLDELWTTYGVEKADCSLIKGL